MKDAGNNLILSNVLGTIGTVLWCVQLIPQIIRNYRKKECTGVPPLMFFLWALCGVPFGIYFISTNSAIPLRVQSEVFMFFSLITWFQSLYYPPVQMNCYYIFLMVGSFVIFTVGLQAGMIMYFQKYYSHDPENIRILIFGILASILLALGLLPPYFELAKRNGRVVGINFLFLAIDCLGALFSMFSVIFGRMDVMGMSIYVICAGLEIGIFTSHIVWLCRFQWFGNDKKSEENKDEDVSISEEGKLKEEEAKKDDLC